MREGEWGLGKRTDILHGGDARVGFQICSEGGFVFKSSLESVSILKMIENR